VLSLCPCPCPSFIRVTKHRWEFPNAAFWDNVGTYVNDGITVVLHCGKTDAVRGGSVKGGGAAPFVAPGSSPYDAVPASAPPSGATGAYHGGSSAFTDI
jgi:hypothetical protein